MPENLPPDVPDVPDVVTSVVRDYEVEETTFDRLTLVENVHSTYFEPPVFVRPGETVWVDGATRMLHVRSPDGAVRTYPARGARPDDIR